MLELKKLNDLNLEKLDDLIDNYALHKSEMESYKKLCDDGNKKIKEEMEKLNMSSYNTGKYKAKISVSYKDKFDEDAVIHYINSVLWGDKGSMTCPYIKMIYAVDWDAIEDAVYKGKITKEQLLEIDKFKITTEVATLRISKNKGEK